MTLGSSGSFGLAILISRVIVWVVVPSTLLAIPAVWSMTVLSFRFGHSSVPPVRLTRQSMLLCPIELKGSLAMTKVRLLA